MRPVATLARDARTVRAFVCALGSVLATQALAFSVQAQPVSAPTAQSVAPRPSADKPRLLVQRIEAIGVAPALARSVEDALILQLGRRGSLTVVSPAELEQTLQMAETTTALGCDDVLDECAAEIQRKLRVQRVINGKVSRLGPEYVLALGLVDLEAGTVGKRVAQESRTVQGLLDAIPSALEVMLGGAPPGSQSFHLAKGQAIKLAVMPLEARGVEAATADALTQIAASELNQVSGVSVMSRDDIRAMLDKVALEGQLGCTDNLECIAEIGAALGLSKLVIGSVGKVKTAYVIAMQLVDVRMAEVQNRVLETFEGDPSELKNAAKLAAYQLIGLDLATSPGELDFTFNVDSAPVRLGTNEYQIRDRRLEVADITPGRYSMRVLADATAYEPLQTDVYVAPGTPNVRTFHVDEKPVPWYKQWWPWTIAGTVAVGAAIVTAVVIANARAEGSGEAIVMVQPGATP